MMRFVPAAARLTRLAVGVLASAALLWFVGPLVAIAGVVPLAGESARWVAMAAVAVALLAHDVWRRARSARRNRRLMDGLVGSGGGPQDEGAGTKDLAVIARRFEQAVGLLRKSRLVGRRTWVAALSGRPFVYELPWYIIIGAPGAGKTTALVNSGLTFPLAKQVGQTAIRGIGGTRHCDWWFASEAVLIDTAGRYTTHDSNRAVDRAAWLGFLGLLARCRPRRPINGVLLTISVGDLLGASPERRAAHAREVRERIEELHTHLGIAVPVYVLVTKTDLLAGFMEFFADFDKDERAQVWGVTFPYQTETMREGPLASMASEFAALEKRLVDCLMDRLQGERDRERRGLVYAFPQQWHLLRQALFEFLQALFADMRAEQLPLVRGVYFTSATQEGTPMDRALGGLARALGLSSRIIPAARPSGKSFFVTRLLRDVVFAEAGLAGTNLRWRRRRTLLASGVVGATLCTVAVAAAWSWQAYDRSRAALASVSQRLPLLDSRVAAASAAAASDLVALLPALDMMREVGGTDAARPLPVVFNMGLDRSDMLRSASHDAYERMLREVFLPRIATRLEQRLATGAREHVELTYEALKTYLMLFGGKNFDAAALRSHLVADWDATLPGDVSEGARQALRRHLDRLLASGEVGAPSRADPKLIAAARSLVASVPTAQRAYHRLKQMDLGANATPFTVESAGGAAARRAFVGSDGPTPEGVPALYSRAVWQQSLRERTQGVLSQLAKEEPWVLGNTAASAVRPSSQEGLQQEVQRLYLADYAARWSGFLDDLRLRPTTDLAATAELAQSLARPDSPLVTVLRASVAEVSLGAAPGPPGASAELASNGTLGAKFDELQRFLSGQQAPIDATRALIGKLATRLAAVDDAVKRKSVPPASDVMRELQAALQRSPEPVRGLLAQLAATSGAQEFAALRGPLASLMATEFTPACNRLGGGRYPLSRGAGEEISREDFVRLFGNGGLIDGFFQHYLAAYVDTATRPWSYHAWATGARREPGESLQQFERAETIRQSYFRDNGRQLGARLELRLLDIDPGASELTLDVDGQVLKFRPGVAAPQSLQWPGPSATGRVNLQLATSGAGAGTGHLFQGPWALYRLLDRVRIEAGSSPDRAQLLFDVEGRRAKLEAKSTAPLNPVLRGELEQFACPSRL